jgi:hypothetical protein
MSRVYENVKCFYGDHDFATVNPKQCRFNYIQMFFSEIDFSIAVGRTLYSQDTVTPST